MSKSNELFELVQSLSRSEKRYFHQYSSQHVKGTKNDYMILFEAITKQREYDEQKLKIHLMKKGCKNEFRHTKHYLYNQLLRALQGYHHNESKYEEVKSLLLNVKILHRKGLHEQARNLLQKAKKIAIDHEFFGDLVDIHNWEIRLMYNTQNFDHWETLFDDVKKLEKDLLNTRDYQQKVADMYVFHLIDYKIKSKERSKQLEKLAKRMSTDITEAKSYTARENYYRFFSTYHRMKDELDKSLELREDLVDLMEENQFLFKEEKVNFLLASTNLLTGLFEHGSYDKALQLTDKILLNTADLKNKPLQGDIYAKCVNTKLQIYLRLGDFDSIRSTLEDPELLNTIDNERDVKLGLYIATIALAYFCLGDYSEAIKLTNQIINRGKVEYGIGNYSAALLINLLAHFEVGNREQLFYYIKNTYRSLKKLNQLHKLEASILKFLRKLTGSLSEKELITNYKLLRGEIETFIDEPFEHVRFENFFFLAWLDHKIDKLPLNEALLKNDKRFMKYLS